jgi:colanic acid/amylovoran biosynthesis glycosyltransferase
LSKVQADGFLSGRFDADWEPQASWNCLTGSCQIAYVWVRLSKITGQKKYFEAAQKLLGFVKRTQRCRTSTDDPIRGGIKGSHPVWGGYDPFRYPNWAAKFYVDALLETDRVLNEKPLVIFYTPVFSSTGGGQHAMALLAQELVERGYELKLFTRPPFHPEHRYVQWLNEVGVSVEVLPRFESRKWLGLLSRAVAVALVLPYALVHRRSLKFSWQAALSIFRTRVSRYEKRYMNEKLSRAAQDRERVILHIWGPAALAPWLLDWAEMNGAHSIYHEMGEADESYVKTWELAETVASINKAQSVICCSRAIEKNIRSVYGYLGKIATIPFMIEDPGEISSIRTRNGRVNLGAIGRLVPHKRHMDLILALRNLRNEGHNVGLVIAGSGPMRHSLEAFAQEQEVADWVTFTGEFEKLADVMQQFDIFTLTSSSESQCMPITESMSYGKPVVASNFGGIPDFVEDGVTGYLVPIGDIAGLTERLREIVMHPTRRIEMGQRGRARYQQFYTPAAVTDAVEKVYAALPEDFPATGLQLGYFVECYATFIVNEICQLRNLGAKIKVFNAFRPALESDPVKEQMRRESLYFQPYYQGLLRALLRALFHKPLTVVKLLVFLLREKETLRMLILAAYSAEIVRKEGLAHLHGTFGTRTTTLAYLTAELAGVDYSFTTHAYDIFNPNPSLVWKTRKASFMRTISAFNKRYIAETYKGIETGKIKVNYLGVDAEDFAPRCDPRDDSRPLKIISVGNLFPKKGHEYLIRACRRLKQKGYVFECEIIGSGNLHEALLREIDDHGLGSCVRLLGEQHNETVKQKLKEADIFALACIDARDIGENLDGIPVALMEAMALGLPSVSTSLSGIPELIDQGGAGLLIPEKDEQALAYALERLLNDASLRQALGRAARQKIEEDFDITKNIQKLAELFQTTVHPSCGK